MKEKNGSTLEDNYLLDYGPITPAKWEKGDPATEMGLRLGIITEADIEPGEQDKKKGSQ